MMLYSLMGEAHEILETLFSPIRVAETKTLMPWVSQECVDTPRQHGRK